MRVLLTAVLFSLGWFATPLPAQEAASIAGSWRGPWYRGMSSGVMVLRLSADGKGTVSFTNLETFGELPAPLIRTRMQGDSFEFRASGASGRDFAAGVKQSADGRMLRGTGRYEGFQVKFELQRQE